MKKMFSKHLCLYMFLALLVTIACIFSLQTYLNQRDNTRSSHEKLEIIREKLISNDEEIAQLTNSLGENALAKSRAFAYMIEQDPSIIESRQTLDEICVLLDVDELHVIDEKGIITHSTIEAYINFDMASADQTKPFLQIIEDPSFELAQEPQYNAAGGVLFQYCGTARMDAGGLVQIGMQPEVLEEMLKGTSVDMVLGSYDFGNNGYLFAVNKADNTIAAHKNSSLIGTDATAAGFPAGLSAGTGIATVDGTKCYYVTEDYNGIIIGTMLPASEYYSVRTSQTLVVSASILVILIALIFMINRLVSSKIVKGIHHITEDLALITDGNLNLVVAENGNPEFTALSASINQMVGSIKQNMEKNEELLKIQQTDMEKNHQLIHDVKEVCRNIENVSQATLSNAKTIRNGTERQKEAVEQLNATITALSSQLQESAGTSEEVTQTTNQSVERMLAAKENMASLMDTIQETADTSSKIVTIIDEIQSIASQTNMLSLNASIEAARAGELGRGFAVVASQVGGLAERSARAAQETTQLITNTIDVISRGKALADTVVDEFLTVVSDMQTGSENIAAIANMAGEQANAILDATRELNSIASVVRENVSVSQESETTSENLADETSRLYRIIES